jgi:hypothetical protein
MERTVSDTQTFLHLILQFPRYLDSEQERLRGRPDYGGFSKGLFHILYFAENMVIICFYSLL